jgi:hypothetical protein
MQIEQIVATPAGDVIDGGERKREREKEVEAQVTHDATVLLGLVL